MKFKHYAIYLVLLGMVQVATGARAAEPVTVLLDWFINPDHAPLVIAEETGIFKQNDLDVTLVEPTDPNMPPKLVAAGQALVAISYQPQLHIQVDQDLPLVRFGTLVSTPLNSLVVIKEGPIQSIADLKGKKVGYSVGGFEEAVLGRMFQGYGLTLADVDLVNVNFSLSPSLLSGQVDAVIGAFRNFELNQMDIVGTPGRAFFPEEHGVPPYDELILVTRRDAVQDPRLPRLLTSLEQAVQFILNHPDQSQAIFAAYKAGLDDELNRRAWRDTLPRFALRPGASDARRYDRFARFLHADGLIKTLRAVEDYTVEIR